MNVPQFSLNPFDKLYLLKKTPPVNHFFLFAFLIFPAIAMHLGVLFKMEMKS